ncbi:MAG TPA: single-stranded DNA-binding protein [Anaerolineales bacterium]|nr:single-stranded DNA-binding protein [Anaerolineales bacterium]
MPALNRVQLIGNLGKDPEVRFTTTGKKVCQFSIAVNRRWKVGSEVKEVTDWFNIEAWGRIGEVCMEFLHKGSLVYIEGRLRTSRYEHDGETRYFTKVIVQNMQMLDHKVEEELPVEPDVEEDALNE